VRRPLAAAAALALLLGACRPDADQARAGRIQALKARQEKLWQALEARLQQDPAVQRTVEAEPEVLVVIQGPLVQSLLRRVAERYLDRVDLDLSLGAKVEAAGDVKAKGITAGTWSLHLVIDRVRGRLQAKKPAVVLKDSRIALELPVGLDHAKGGAQLRFNWDSKGVANLVCHDFEITRRVEAVLEPTVEVFSGTLSVEAAAEGLRAVPAFRDVPYTVRPVPTPESWKVLEDALREQDSFLKCGIALDPDTMLPKLRQRLDQGFAVRLPKKLFRPFLLPASIRTSVEREGRRLELAVLPGELRFVDGGLWYASRVDVKMEKAAGK
jgi:hypothetical protein